MNEDLLRTLRDARLLFVEPLYFKRGPLRPDGSFSTDRARSAEKIIEAAPKAAELLQALEAELSDRMTRESGIALIEESGRWERAYCEARDELAALDEQLATHQAGMLEWRKRASRAEADLQSAEIVANVTADGVWTIRPGDDRPELRYVSIEERVDEISLRSNRDEMHRRAVAAEEEVQRLLDKYEPDTDEHLPGPPTWEMVDVANQRMVDAREERDEVRMDLKVVTEQLRESIRWRDKLIEAKPHIYHDVPGEPIGHDGWECDPNCAACHFAARARAATKDLRRTLFIAEHLFAMVSQEAWRDTGGDDMQGHWEGDYHAEGVMTELAEIRARVDESFVEGDDE